MGATDLTRLTRREFVKSGFVFGAGAAGLAAGYAAVPDVMARAVYAGKKDGVMNDRVLVMLQLAAQLIVSGVGAKILHVTLGGFDTHDQEFARHEDLMGYVDGAVTAFHNDLAAYGMSDRVLVATWSEFGRRAQETGNGGTDHGTAAPMFLIGDTGKGGMYGQAPSLHVGRDGNLKYTVG